VTDFKKEMVSNIQSQIKIKARKKARASLNQEQRRPMMVSIGGHTEGCQPIWDLDHRDTNLAGAINRILQKKKRPTKKILRAIQGKCGSWSKQFRQLPGDVDYCSDEQFEIWLQETKYPQWRCDQLRQIRREQPLEPKTSKNENFVGSFGKNEQKSKYTFMRTINARGDYWKAWFGPWIHAIEKCVFENDTFVKRVPVEKRFAVLAESLDTPGQSVDYTDHNAYESVFTPPFVQAATLPLYSWITARCMNSDVFMRVYSAIINCGHKIKSKFFEFLNAFTECSGEMDTSLKNGAGNKLGAELANAMTRICDSFDKAIVVLLLTDMLIPSVIEAAVVPHTCAVQGEVTVPLPARDARMGAEGDDGVQTASVSTDARCFNALGFDVKVERKANMEGGDFCSMDGSLETGESVGNPINVICRLPFLRGEHVYAHRGRKLALLRARALSLLAMFPSCPISTAYGLYILRVTKHVNMKNFVENERGVGKWRMDQYRHAIENEREIRLAVREPSTPVRFVVESRYFVPVCDQIAIENYFASLHTLQVLSCKTLDLYIPSVCFDYYHRFCEYTPDITMPDNFIPYVYKTYNNFPPTIVDDLKRAGLALEFIPGG
jgi:hypothetical protein